MTMRHRRNRHFGPIRAIQTKIPPADWRMPAEVATDTEALDQLTAASANAAAKDRPVVTLPGSATRYAEWVMDATGTLFYSQIASGPGVNTALSLNGAKLSFANTPEAEQREGVAIPVDAGDVLRAIWTTGSSARNVHPLLHKRPDTGPWDSHLFIGASREDDQPNLGWETDIIAAHPGRDPVIFVDGQSGGNVQNIAADAPARAAQYAGMAHYVLAGTLIGNNVSNGRPYDAAQFDSIHTALDTIRAAYGAFEFAMSNTSYRQYRTDPAVTPANQQDGSAPYNDRIVHPWVAANLPELYDPTIKRSRVDEYLEVLLDRNALIDGIHGAYAGVRALWTDSWFRFVYTRAWGPSQIERRIADAEAKARDSSPAANSRTAFTEAEFALAALEQTDAKDELAGRLDAISGAVLRKIADEATGRAETTRTQEAKETAQSAIDAAAAAGADVSALQTRLDAVTVNIASPAQIIRIQSGGGTRAPGFNLANEHATGDGIHVANLKDIDGKDTGIVYQYRDGPEQGPQTWLGTISQAAGVSQIAWLPDAVTTRGVYGRVSGITPISRSQLTGIPAGKVCDIEFYGTRSGSAGRNTVFGVNGTALPQIDAANNYSHLARAVGVTPVDGSITLSVTAGSPTNDYFYQSAMQVTIRDA
ncbi:MAG: hypothetical protein WA948_03435 [Pontixanthobacter sp.]